MGIVWSFSRLSSYSICPQQYRFQYIDKIEVEMPKKMSRGKSFHDFAEAFYNDSNRIDNIKEFTNKLLSLPDNVIDKTKKLFVKNEGERLSLLGDVDRLVEYEVKGQIKGYDFIGYIDLLEILNNNSYNIIDFKPKKLSNMTTLRRQLGIYKMLFEQDSKCIVPDNIMIGAYYYKTGNYWYEELSKRSFNATQNWIDKTIKRINNDKEFRHNANPYNCKNCKFNKKYICKDRIL
jgi:CRISPR/Cas system-associated exonuclease Cas4 (RecB family)